MRPSFGATAPKPMGYSDERAPSSVPALMDSGRAFGFTSDAGYGITQDRPIVVQPFRRAGCEGRATVPGRNRPVFRRQRLALSHGTRLPPPSDTLQLIPSQTPGPAAGN
jgi:hypothetical protein